ncbi:hypothetical protein CATMIT_02010, partial [Catenibacterium mitsuokai DSM 15897]
RAHTPLYQVAFVMQNTPDGTLHLPQMEIEPILPDTTSAQIDLWWSATETGERIECSVVFAKALFDADTIVRWSGHWKTLLAAMVANDARPVSRLPLLSSPQRRQVLENLERDPAPVPARTQRGAAGAGARARRRADRGCNARRREPELRRTQCPRQPSCPSPDRAGRASGPARGAAAGTRAGPDRGDAGHAQGRRRLRAVDPAYPP